MVTKTAMYWQKNKQAEQWNRRPEISPHRY
jgi:hypothetical protein